MRSRACEPSGLIRRQVTQSALLSVTVIPSEAAYAGALLLHSLTVHDDVLQALAISDPWLSQAGAGELTQDAGNRQQWRRRIGSPPYREMDFISHVFDGAMQLWLPTLVPKCTP